MGTTLENLTTRWTFIWYVDLVLTSLFILWQEIWTQEEEIDTAQQIQQLLRTLNEKLSGDELDSLIVDEYEEETVISDNSFPRRTFGKKTQKMLTAELNNYCKEWRSQFCYVG